MRYFRFYSESLAGETGSLYCEVSPQNQVTRQINVFGDRLYWAEPGRQRDERYPFTDQPEFDEAADGGEEIGQADFLALWQQGQHQ